MRTVSLINVFGAFVALREIVFTEAGKVRFSVIILSFCIIGGVFAGIGFHENGVVPENDLKIMTYNSGTFKESLSKTSIETFASILRKESPDILLLQEAYWAKVEKVNKLLNYRMFSLPFKTKQHVRILSRYPIKFKAAKKLRDYDGNGKNVVCAEIETDKGPLLVCSVYFTSVRSQMTCDKMTDKATLVRISLREVFFENSRSREAVELIDWLASMNYENVIIGGDFNALFFSKATRKMRKMFNDSSWLSPSLFSSSHKSHRWYLPIKVDYIFLSKNLSFSGTKIIQESPGDHYPVVTNISGLIAEN